MDDFTGIRTRVEALFENFKIAIRHVSDKNHKLAGTLDLTKMYCDHGVVLAVPYKEIEGSGLTQSFKGYEKRNEELPIEYIAAVIA